MLTPALAMVVALLQQPTHESAAARAARTAAFDSTEATFRQVGLPVAQVRSGIDVYRRAVFGETDDDVLRGAAVLRRSCETADTTVRHAEARLCRHCAASNVQAAFDAYRGMLPSLRAAMARCAGRLRQLERGSEPAKQLRAAVREVGNPLIETLRRYERYVTRVRMALGITPANPPRPARGR
jgi:hypothetical protein